MYLTEAGRGGNVLSVGSTYNNRIGIMVPESRRKKTRNKIRGMSIWSGKGFLITVVESEVTCPICNQVFDCSAKAAKAKYPVFNMKCPFCKGKITISEPIFGGELKCWETDCPKTIKRLETTTENKINGIPISQFATRENNEDDDEDSDDDWQAKPLKPITL